MSSSTTIAATDEKAIGQVLGLRFCKMVERSAANMEVIGKTPEIARNTKTGALIRPEGMTDAEWNLCCDAMRSNKDVPFYLLCDAKRVETAYKIAGDRANAPQELARLVVHLVKGPPKEYGTIDVTPVGKE
jgi:hypothetical protein